MTIGSTETSNPVIYSVNSILKVGVLLVCVMGRHSRHSVVVTLWYRAPELLFGHQGLLHTSTSGPLGAFGELLHMEALFPGKSEVDEVNKIFKLLGTPSEKTAGIQSLPR